MEARGKVETAGPGRRGCLCMRESLRGLVLDSMRGQRGPEVLAGEVEVMVAPCAEAGNLEDTQTYKRGGRWVQCGQCSTSIPVCQGSPDGITKQDGRIWCSRGRSGWEYTCENVLLRNVTHILIKEVGGV